MENDRIQRATLDRERVDEADIRQAARERQGLERLDQVNHAVREKGGLITTVPKARLSAWAAPGDRHHSPDGWSRAKLAGVAGEGSFGQVER